ncbi:alkaline phosphatase family protein [Mycolicibacterium farcinogenes]|nr:alkaline phosphatase family protein [Mycolicibacterium farcinogenes]
MPDRPSVLLIVVDGLRPDAIDSALMPYLSSLRDEGCQYTSAVASFPSVTRSNAATLATGAHPARHGVFGNRVWHKSTGVLDTGKVIDVRSLLSVGAMPQPSLSELLERAGHTAVVVGNGSAGCTQLLNPGVDRGHGAAIASVGAVGSPTIGLPARVQESLVPLGSPPEPADDSLDWAGDAAVACLDTMRPDLLTFWSGQPDTVHHHTGPWSAASQATLRRIDDVIRRIHAAAQKPGRPCNVIVTADHGFCETTESMELDADLNAAAAVGIDPDDVVSTYNSGVVLVYLRDHVGPADRAALANELAQQVWAGPVVCNDEECPDTAFPASWVTGGDSDFAPDIFVTMAADATQPDGPNPQGRAIHARPTGSKAYAGVHGTLHPRDMQIPLILHGPDFATRATESTPAGIVDIAPTIHRLLLAEPMPEADGRELTEALRSPAGRRSPSPSATVVNRQRGRHRLTFHDTDKHRYLLGSATIEVQP